MKGLASVSGIVIVLNWVVKDEKAAISLRLWMKDQGQLSQAWDANK